MVSFAREVDPSKQHQLATEQDKWGRAQPAFDDNMTLYTGTMSCNTYPAKPRGVFRDAGCRCSEDVCAVSCSEVREVQCHGIVLVLTYIELG